MPMGTIFLVEDDAAIRDSLGLMLGLAGYAVMSFSDGDSFFSAFDPSWHGCLLLDIRMPGMDGLTVQRRLREQGNTLPVIVMTGHGTVEDARTAFRAEAVDFLEKPLDPARLSQALSEAFASLGSADRDRQRRADYRRLVATLTPRETEIFDLVVTGMHNRDIARRLRISPRTVEVHKARVLGKLGASSVADLVKTALEGGG